MSEKLLIKRLTSLSAKVRGPVKEALLDAAMALEEAERAAAELRDWRRQAVEAMTAGMCDGITPEDVDSIVRTMRVLISRASDSAPAALAWVNSPQSDCAYKECPHPAECEQAGHCKDWKELRAVDSAPAVQGGKQ